MAELNRDPHVYLLPDCDTAKGQEELLSDFYHLIFGEELMGWWTVEEDWPVLRDLATFKRWFQFHSLIIDLADAPLDDDE
jgi:hypothetical protein